MPCSFFTLSKNASRMEGYLNSDEEGWDPDGLFQMKQSLREPYDNQAATLNTILPRLCSAVESIVTFV